jgi:hypothetical protein
MIKTMSELLTFNTDIMDIIVNNLDTESHLIVGLTCKEMYKVLKTFNQHKKLNATLRYLTSNLNLLKYAHLNKCLWQTGTIDVILVNSNEPLECLKYAHKNGCPWHSYACSYAALGGDLECLKYCHENGCPWHESTSHRAAYNGHLECIKYCHENGCPWSEYTCIVADRNGHLACVKYCRDNWLS